MMKKYRIPIYYLAMLALAGVLLFPHIIWQGAENYSVSFSQYSPLLATLLLLRLGHDKNAASEIKNGLRLRSCNIVWYILSAAVPMILTGISAVILTALCDSQYHAWNGTATFYILNTAAMLLGSMGEEIGWRGYLLPSLKKKYSPFVSSIIVGVLWGFWHLIYAGDIIFWLLFIVTTIEMSIILTFLAGRANGNIWTAIIFHTFCNLANRVFILERFNINLLIIEIAVLGVACLTVILLDRKQMFKSRT